MEGNGIAMGQCGHKENGPNRFQKIADSVKRIGEQDNLFILLFLSDQYNKLNRNSLTVTMLAPKLAICT